MSISFSYLTDDHHALQQQVKDVAGAEIEPRVQRMEAKGPHADRELRQVMGNVGWLGVLIEPEWGGMDAGHVAKTLMLAQVSYASATAGAILQASILGTAPIQQFGSEEMQRMWLPLIASGEVWPTIAVTEPDTGSHVLGMRSSALRDGDEWIIDGEKDFIGNAAIADVHCVVVRTGASDSQDPRSLTAFLIEADRPGVEVIHRPVSGLRGFSVDGLRLTKVRLPQANMIGGIGDGLAVALSSSVVYGRLNIAAVALGIHQRIMDVTTDWVSARPRYGGHLSDLDIVRNHLAEMQSRLMSAQLAAYHAAHLLDQGQACDEWLFNAKLVNDRWAIASADEAKRLHGGHALRIDNPFERLLRDIQLLNAPAGPDDIQLKRLAETLLGPSRTQWSKRHAASRRRPLTRGVVAV
ncbi:MAG: acyl-CoA/acyl-ACP dehydrogenase [Streptomycetaceae bacterium]|nr:acyl-CoA/acyl-ACP dehydrogenase [Streptomycetaceae bacterium]